MFNVRVQSEDAGERLAFSVGRPSADMLRGTLHLFRSGGEDAPSAWDALGKSRTLLIVAVPSLLSPSDVATWLGPHAASVQHMRFVREPTSASRCAVLLRLASITDADRLVRSYQGRRFSPLAPECARILVVARVECASPAGALESDPLVADPGAWGGDGGSSRVSGAGEVDGAQLPTCPVCLERLDSSVSGVLTTLCNHDFHCACMSSWRDDTCPVCRFAMGGEEEEDVGEGEGRTLVCDVCGCGAGDGALWMCLICGAIGCGRYRSEHALGHSRESGHTYAVEVGVGRVWDYSRDGYVHRLLQNRADGKLVELPDPGAGSSSAREWAAAGGGSGGGGAGGCEDKESAVGFEYTLLLTSQLESQRGYFEAMLSSLLALVPAEGGARREAEELLFAAGHGAMIPGAVHHGPAPSSPPLSGGGGGGGGSAGGRPPVPLLALGPAAPKGKPSAASSTSAPAPASPCADDLATRAAALAARLAEAEKRLAASERERKAALRAAASAKERAEDLTEEVAFLRDLNESLTADAVGWKGCEAGLRAELAEAGEQMRDLMFALEGGGALARAAAADPALGADLVGGSVTVGPAAGGGAGGGGGRGRRGGGK